ncbi:hypothetical protein UMZ34_16755 [Halopseudomonas pachastrellae]|nr:hypothetical protein UMZ34_16755 [Halopseudomonas pachastrellae]
MEIHYEPHPVSPERKAELRAKGLKIIDARFKPADLAQPRTPTATSHPRASLSIRFVTR